MAGDIMADVGDYGGGTGVDLLNSLPMAPLNEMVTFDSTSTAPPIRPDGFSPGSAYSNDLGNFLTLSRKMSDGDPLWENMIEFVDMTGVASYDDAWRAYTDYKKGDIGELTLMLEGMGALPIVGKIKRFMAIDMMPNATATEKAVAKAMNAYGNAKVPLEVVNKYDAVDDALDDNVDPLIKVLYGTE